MKMIRLLPAIVCVALVTLALPARAAELKVGVIELKKVFEGYYKTKLAQAALDEEVTGLKKDGKALEEDYGKAVDDYKKTIDEANNQAISADERDKRKKDAENKMLRINDLKQTLQQFERTAGTNLAEKRRLTMGKILGEIKEAITAKSKSGGFTLVLDTSTPDPMNLPTVLYSSGENDLTAAVLDSLNANAPSNLPKTEPAKEPKK
jgi:Skp family chaperone for outer membrane proteins